MTESQSLENINADNEESLQTLLRAIAFSQGEFSLILVVCNYAALWEIVAQRLIASSSVKIEKIELGKFVPNLYSTILDKLGEEKPPALMVFGLEAVEDLDRLLTSANYVREEFRKNLQLPVLLWVNDEVIEKFIRLAPDIFSWSTTVEFSMATDELIELIRHKTNQLFAAETNFYLENFSEAWREIAAAERDLQNRQSVLLQELEACLQVWHGLNDFTNNRLDEALKNYQESFLFWQQENHRERQGILLLAIAECYKQKAIQQRVKNQEFWQKEKDSLQQSLDIFEKAQRLDLVAKHIRNLGEVLRRLQAWSELKSLVEKKAIKLHLTYEKPTLLAQDRGFLAQVALEESRWDEAKQQAEAALTILAESPQIQPYELQEKGFYKLILAFSLQKLGEKRQAEENLNQAFRESKPQYEPQLYIDILGKLRKLYFQERDYGKAFKIKQEQYAIQYHYNFLAFAGVAHFTAKTQIINSSLTETAKRAIVEREIAASGREQDVKQLWERISRVDCKLIVIHGQSGVGKSSLVRAKLFPKLQQEKIDNCKALPVLLRFYNDWVKTLGDNLREGLQEVTGESLSDFSRDVENLSPNLSPTRREALNFSPFPGREGGWGVRSGGLFPHSVKSQESWSASLDSPEEIIQQLHKNAELNLLTVLIFDQFEEFFFVYREPKSTQIFYRFLDRCLNIPYCKVILSMREDYLHCLLELNRLDNKVINKNILDKKILYSLGNFSRPEAKLVIASLTKQSQFELESALFEKLVEDLAADLDGVLPIELQIVGAQLEAEKITSLAKYRELGENPTTQLVARYLADIVNDCGEENIKLARLVLYLLTNENNTRPLKTRAELVEELELKTDNLDLVLEILVGSGLVVQVEAANTIYYQLVHDYLVWFIRQQQGAELLAELKREKEGRRLILQRTLYGAIAAAFLMTILASVAGLQWRLALLYQVAQSDALSRSSDALFLANQNFDALIAGLQAGKSLKQVWSTADSDTRIKVVTALRMAVYGVQERNRLEGHNAEVRSVSFSPNGETIASGSSDNRIKLWSRDGKLLKTLSGHNAGVWSVSFSPDGQTLASGSWDNTIKLWSKDGKLLHTLSGHKNTVTSVSFSPDGETIASGSWDNTIKLWSKDGKLLHTLSGDNDMVWSVSFSPDGETIASGSEDNKIKLWSKDGKLLKTLSGHNARVMSVSFSPDGETIASGSEDNTIKLWSKDGKLLKTLSGHNKAVTSVSFSLDGQTLASGSWDNTIKLWSKDGKLLHTLSGHNDMVWSVSFSPHGQTLASGSVDKMIKLWSKDGKLLHTLSEHNKAVTSVSFSPDGETIASGSSDNTIKLWSKDGKLLKTLSGHNKAVTSVSFSPDGEETIASGSSDNTIKLWSKDGKLLKTLSGHNKAVTSVSFSPDGETIASGSEDNKIKLWSRDGKLLRTLSGHNGSVISVSFSPDGETIASGSGDKTIKLWSKDGKLLKTLSGHNTRVMSVSFSPDGETIASGSEDNKIKLWSRDGKLRQTLSGHNARVMSVSFSPDGETLASGSRENTIKLWSRDGKLLKTLSGHNAAVISVSFSPDGETLASGSWDNTIILWNLDLDDLLAQGCDWVRDYLTNNINVSESDKRLCAGIESGK